MTILSSKKPSNNTNKDSSSNQQQQQITPLNRTRLPRDDEHSNGTNSPINLTQDSNETNLESSSSITTDNLHSIITATTSPIFCNNSKRKSHNHHPRHFHQTITKQARRRCTSIEENLSSNEDNTASSAITTIDNQQFDENDQCNSEDEYDQTTLKYDRNNLNEVCYLI
jgi:hypothetical protein